MKGNGNDLNTLLKKMFFFMIPTSGLRTRYIRRRAKEFHKLGEGLFWQPRNYPSVPELISIGNNVKIASGVNFINHDIIHSMINLKFETQEFERLQGCIEIGDNVMIGAYTKILPNVKIGSNVIIAAGAIVTKNIPSNSVAAGSPCKVIGDFAEFVKKRREYKSVTVVEAWEEFMEKCKA